MYHRAAYMSKVWNYRVLGGLLENESLWGIIHPVCENVLLFFGNIL